MPRTGCIDLEGQAMSERFTHSFKKALAIVLAYGLALWFDWARPMWAAFAVAMISLPTLEAGLGKGGQRLWGTALATLANTTLMMCLVLLLIHACSAVQVFRVEDDAMVGAAAEGH